MQRTIQIFLISATALIPLNANAAESTIQQVSWQGCGNSNCTPEGCDSTACRNQKCSPHRPSREGRKARRGDYCDVCDGNGNGCNLKSASHDFALNWCGDCGPIGCMARCGFPCAKTIRWCCNTKAFPDSGWAPPAHNPIHRTGGGYSSYGGHGGYGYMGGGYGPGAPMIYQPTDTTQLGYSYSNVPTWRANANMIPGVPDPSAFHTRFCPADPRCGGCSTSCDTGYVQDGFMPGNCMNGQCMGDPMIMGHAGTGNAPGVVRMTPRQAMPRRMQTVGLPVKSIRPMQSQRPQVQNVSNQIQKTAATTAQTNILDQQPKSQEAQRPSPPVSLAKQQVQNPPQQRKPNVNRNAGRSAGAGRPAPRKSGGWLGLPSLSEMTL